MGAYVVYRLDGTPILCTKDLAEAILRADENAPAFVNEDTVICGCTNTDLEAGKTCGRPECPNGEGSNR